MNMTSRKPPVAHSLSLAMIVRNEEEHLARCLDSVRDHVDEIVLVDTGSTDRTKEIALSYGAKVIDAGPAARPDLFFEFDGQLWLADFASARNISYDAATCDYVMWLDADAVVFEAAKLRAAVALFAARLWRFDTVSTICERSFDGSRWLRDRITKRGKFRWVYPVHECLLVRTDRHLAVDEVVIRHMRNGDTPARSLERYGVLVRRYLAAHPNDERMRYYLRQELLFTKGAADTSAEVTL